MPREGILKNSVSISEDFDRNTIPKSEIGKTNTILSSVQKTLSSFAQIQEKSTAKLAGITSNVVEKASYTLNRITPTIDQSLDEVGTAITPLYTIAKQLLGINSVTDFVKDTTKSVLSLPKTISSFFDKPDKSLTESKPDKKLLKNSIESKKIDIQNREQLEDIADTSEKVYKLLKKAKPTDGDGAFAGGITGGVIGSSLRGIGNALIKYILPVLGAGAVGYGIYKVFGADLKKQLLESLQDIREKELGYLKKQWLESIQDVKGEFVSLKNQWSSSVQDIKENEIAKVKDTFNYLVKKIDNLVSDIREKFNQLIKSILNLLPGSVKETFTETKQKVGSFLDPLAKKLQKTRDWIADKFKREPIEEKETLPLKKSSVKLTPKQQEVAEKIGNIALKHKVSPEYLITLANIESGFDPTAVSKSGAEGVFQFIPSTAQLPKVNLPLNKRVDVKESTLAKIRLLKSDATDLKNAGFKSTVLTDMLAHQLGSPDAIRLLRKAQRGEKVSGKLKEKLNVHLRYYTKSGFASDYIKEFEKRFLEHKIGDISPKESPFMEQKGIIHKEVPEVDFEMLPSIKEKPETINKPQLEREKMSRLSSEIKQTTIREKQAQPVIINNNQGGSIVEESGTNIGGVQSMIDNPFIILGASGLI